MRHLLLSLRPAHWVKNFFVFLPLFFGGKLFSYPENLHTVLAALLFCGAAGAVYLINDILDLGKDRLDPVKRLRPLPSGKISSGQALGLAIPLAIGSCAGAAALNKTLGLIILLYLVSNILYTFVLKKAVILDVFCIAGFFLLRIAAGGITAQVELSHWILFLGSLLALFLGFNKRRQELYFSRGKSTAHREVLSHYSIYFLDQMIGVVTSSIVIVYLLYAVDARTTLRVGSNHLLFSVPLVYYGIFRYLYLIHKLNKYGDPTRLLLSDRKLRLSILFWALVNAGVIYLGW